ncbi:MAG TPA: 2-C-methyl-D-erythritol 4-phosphate cytidylyltransferase [Candidatus Limnocylindrales bacterium]|nr:2-C-methyl-D-erythritol 4-phosphate cytidylyltransferase [Candidatus Limnocylindrales bacterium]
MVSGAGARFADAVVVAAGASRRMGGRDKLALPLSGRPLLAWTLDALAAARSVRRLIVVAAPERQEELEGQAWLRRHAATVVAGGDRRQESVAAGVAAADAEVVLVHDGARPLVSPDLADAVAEAARAHGAAIPVLAVSETVKRLEVGRVTATLDREGLGLAQTPQGVRRELLLEAYRRIDPAGPTLFTDEAALLEAVGTAVAAVAGEPANMKVTTPADARLAEQLLRGAAGPLRAGIGRDGHPFGPHEPLALGGITIEGAPRLHGHSDGDAALHAVADALLGAAALGDLGRLFPAGDPATAGIDSRRLLAGVVERLAAAGLHPAGLDLTIIGARPRLGAERLAEMAGVIASLLELDTGSVSVKASTGNLDGPEGAGRSISALAVAQVGGR